MRRPRNLARLAAAVLALTLIAAACGDDDTTTAGDDDAATATADAEPSAGDDEMAMDDTDGDHEHGAIEYDGDTVPTVELVVEEDPVSGWNVFASVGDGYTFAPEHASTEHVPGEGHAHVYVDGEKLGRVYGENHHIVALEPGTHTITYSLSANDHSDYLLDGEPLAASVTVEVPEPDDDGGQSHAHEPREWDGDGTPTVEVAVAADPESGWNVIATIDGFSITPEAASTDHVPGEGHMHIYVNGVKLGRMYEPAVHLAQLPAGTNEVEVRLSGNDHSDYTVDGEPLGGTATVEVTEADGSGAVAAGEDGHDHEHAGGEGATPVDDGMPADVTIEAAFAAGSVETEASRYDVSAGEVVRIEVASDVAEEVHVHGYDLYGEARPEEPAVIVFDASIPGVFEVELEDSATLLFELAVR